MGMDPESTDELLAAAHALVAWEQEISGWGFPEEDPAAVALPRGPVPGARAPDPPGAPQEAPVAARPSAGTAEPPRDRDAGRDDARDRGRDGGAVSAGDRREPAAPAPSVPAPITSEPAPTMDPGAAISASGPPTRRLELLAEQAASCTRCRLHEGRSRSVFARGTYETDIAFVGEGPGFHEDKQGLPFVGPAGQLLDKMVAGMGYPRDGVYICNVVKCRPPNNRTPQPDEARACSDFLVGQLDVVQPKVIVALGRCATENLGVVEVGARGWRGKWGAWRGIPVMPTYHPAFLLRSPQFKRAVWEDLKKVLARLGKEPPRRK